MLQILLLAIIQGAAELLPVSSSAHVIVAEKLMGLDPTRPELTFLLVMLHTGTMVAVLVYFWKRWMRLWSRAFVMQVALATLATGAVGLGLKKGIEGFLRHRHPGAELESLFGNLTLIAIALAVVGLWILFAGTRKPEPEAPLDAKTAGLVGLVQGLCLPFRGFSRSGATISMALVRRVPQALAEDFSFALAVVLTPPVILLETHRLMKARAVAEGSLHLRAMLGPGLLGMVLSFLAGLAALKFLSSLLENHRWKYFGFYCLAASAIVFFLGK